MSSAFSQLPVLPEIRQEDASAAVARIYSDIKRASGTPLVNLIYRHLATIPGGLESGESGEGFHAAMRLARYSSSHPAVLRRRRMESLPGAFRVRL
ncbi:hypothetical protein SAMN05443247_04908 [Bradyrhizobium erythrophlei]|nr:hypothetical protein SAMN05443247_04908 [Bradyrhizobium erythrophlei]